jgi:hypothetical protein
LERSPVSRESKIIKEDGMPDRRRLRRETLEIYLVHFLLAYRLLIWFIGILMLAYAIATMFIYPLAGYATLLPAFFLLLLCNSFTVVLFTARLGAWIGTFWRHDD